MMESLGSFSDREGVALHRDILQRLLLVSGSQVTSYYSMAWQDIEHGRIIVIHNKVEPVMLTQSRATHPRVSSSRGRLPIR